MAPILDGLNTVKQSLAAQQFALSVTQRNTVNVNNPNYTRQDVIFSDPTSSMNRSEFGVPGVELRANRNGYLDYSISRELSALTENAVKYNSLREIDAVLQGTSGGGLGTSISDFFNSFTTLGGNPTDLTLRWQAVSQANILAGDFNRLYGEIQRVQTSADQHVVGGVEDVNRLTARIADLNGRVETAHSLKQSENEFALRDERQQCIEELQGKIGVLYFETESGSITITTTQGDALVLGNTSQKLQICSMADSPFAGISLNGKDITGIVASGEIGGYIQMRDSVIPGYLATLDDMAAVIIERVNEIHAQGEDIDGNAGGNFFVPFTQLTLGSNTGAARAMSAAIDDPRKVAAAAPGSGIGDNGNAKALAAINGEKLFAGGTQTAGETYASLIYRVGADERNAKDTAEVQQSLLGQFLGQRNSVSGISLNEEAVNLIKYQRAYQASSRFATVLNSLSAEILQFVGV